MCSAAVVLVGDLFRVLTINMLPYCDDIVSRLITNLGVSDQSNQTQADCFLSLLPQFHVKRLNIGPEIDFCCLIFNFMVRFMYSSSCLLDDCSLLFFQDPALDRSVKPQILSSLSDIASAIGSMIIIVAFRCCR